jgi:ribonuclease HI
MGPKAKFYVVWKGRKAGVFSSWEACAAQVQGFTGAQYKSFTSRTAAEKAFRGRYAAHAGKPVFREEWLISPHSPVVDSYCVDAACSGSPGPLEYRGVHLRNGKEIFRLGPYQHGTNNVGEFLAIVHALVMLEKQKKGSLTVYSDSSTAIGWVRKKRCNTELVADELNAPLFKLLDQAEEWLTGHSITNPILKWDTKAWGEIPADFNRK